MPFRQPTLANSDSTKLQNMPTPVKDMHPQKWAIPEVTVGKAQNPILGLGSVISS